LTYLTAKIKYASLRDSLLNMSGPKAALKAIAAAVKAQKYDDAVQEAQKLLASDPRNYQA